ncbi:hypothetical protein ABEB36_005435 [Hypothenemus hampei]|uniref:tRNA (34-2'-O)-methyltransferase regulator WDR6 n=1 Tax=Hypothenemus hampei TaxID=57062 RepID=A0ABD1EY80_HYPHA
MFRSMYLHTDVTCLEILHNQIFAGVGGSICIYDLVKRQLIKRKIVFEGKQILGIRANSQGSKLMVYAGKHIALFNVDSQTFELEPLGNRYILSDWILDGKWIEEDKKFVTVFMHNKATVWNDNFISEKSVKCEERCILYSAYIISKENYEQLIVLSGTVFSEILLWKPSCIGKNGLSPVLKRLKQHKGVIFSINCNLENGLICSVSDDRSAVLWKISNPERLDNITPTNCTELDIIVKCQVYGHQSRVFKCLILNDEFITAGEDSLLVVWTHQGFQSRKIDAHQGGPVWSIASHEDLVVTGGNDGAIVLSKLKPQFLSQIIRKTPTSHPKFVAILQSGNLICMSQKAVLYYYLVEGDCWKEISSHPDLLNYNILKITPCRKLVALAGIQGQIYIYKETKDQNLKLILEYFVENRTRIFSFHWIDCKTFLVSQQAGILGLYFIHEGFIHFIQNFILPHSKEPWPTCIAQWKNHLILGDRNGHVHNFKIGITHPLNTVRRAHTVLGVSDLCVQENTIISLGRDGLIKRYQFSNQNSLICVEHTKIGKVSWLISIYNNHLLSFLGHNFVILDLKYQRTLFETCTGGGHRSWDLQATSTKTTLVYIRRNTMSTVNLKLDDFNSVNLTESFHAREINCAKIVSFKNNFILISGGEDTVLSISSFHDSFKVLKSLKVHLSSIRTICIHSRSDGDYILLTAGGRGQIICWHLIIDNFYTVVSCSEKYNFYKNLNVNEAETRIMDLSIFELNNQLHLFAGCSDGFIKIFLITKDLKLQYIDHICHSRHSITKIAKFSLPKSIELLGSMATDGELKFWLISPDKLFRELATFRIHQSGITCYSMFIIDNKIWFLSGGDDNCVILTLFLVNVINNVPTVNRECYLEDPGIHCAQITGAFLNNKYFITSAIDQKLVVTKWKYSEGQLQFLAMDRYHFSIADPQGLDTIICQNQIILCVYGIGFELLKISINDSDEVL